MKYQQKPKSINNKLGAFLHLISHFFKLGDLYQIQMKKPPKGGFGNS
jgi:hypothetical protein